MKIPVFENGLFGKHQENLLVLLQEGQLSLKGEDVEKCIDFILEQLSAQDLSMVIDGRTQEVQEEIVRYSGNSRSKKSLWILNADDYEKWKNKINTDGADQDFLILIGG